MLSSERERSLLTAAYAELHCHSAYSFLDGASRPEELAAQAHEQGHGALALTDHDNLCGALEFAHAAKALGVRPITGCELTVEDGHGPFHVTLLVETRTGYSNLSQLLTAAHARDRLVPRTPLAALCERAEGLVCLTGCARQGALVHPDERVALERCRMLYEAFGRAGLRVELQRPLWRGDRARNRRLLESARLFGLRPVATNDVHVHDRRRGALQDALVAIRTHLPLEACEAERRGNREHVLKSPREMALLFGDLPEATRETVELAERLRFDLTQDLGYRYPAADDTVADAELAQICALELERRYRGLAAPRRGAHAARRGARADPPPRPLGLLPAAPRDPRDRARDRDRGARAALGAHGAAAGPRARLVGGLDRLLPHRPLARRPRRGAALARALPQPRAGLGARHRPRLPARHPGEADPGGARPLRPRAQRADRGVLDLPLAQRDPRARQGAGPAAARPRPPGAGLRRLARRARGRGARADATGVRERSHDRRFRALAHLCGEIAGLPRHLSQHPGGMIVSTGPLAELVPLVPAAMEGRQICQWDKDSCADAGFLKIDLLGLGMLSAVEGCIDLIARARGETLDLSRAPLDDPGTYAEIQAADTVGVFQIESRAQMQMLLRTRPENLEDLTVEVALVRPGPIQGGAVHPYLERREAVRADPDYRVPHDHPLLAEALADTLGVIVYQDQVLDVAVALAGFSQGQAESLRRAMSRRRSREAMVAHWHAFRDGARGRGVDEPTARRVFEKIVAFSEFGFPKAHAAAFGLLAYQSAWLRRHYPAEFLCALLNEQPMGFYPPASLVRDAQRRGVEVRGADVNASLAACSIEPDGAVRIGLGYVRGLGQPAALGLVEAREAGRPVHRRGRPRAPRRALAARVRAASSPPAPATPSGRGASSSGAPG